MVMRVEKVIGSVPATPLANTVYLVRTGAGFDVAVTDATATTAHALNPKMTWGYLKDHWSAVPTLLETVAAGKVYSYTLNGVTRYRLVPIPYLATGDAFYGTFTGGVLSGLIATKG